MDNYIKAYQNEDYDTVVIEDINDLNTMKLCQVKIMQMNIRSMQKNFNDFELFLETISVDFDVIILSETFQVEDVGLFNLNGYELIYNNAKYNRNDGTIVYVKSNMEF